MRFLNFLRDKKTGGAVTLALVVLATSIYAPLAKAYDKNYLIDDSLFVDTTSLSVNQIQSELNKGGGLLANWVDDVDMYATDSRFKTTGNRCLVHKATGMTAAEVIQQAANDWQATYVVWKNNGVEVSKDPREYNGEVDECSVVRKYADSNLPTISPKAIITTLEKEQSLITASGSYSKTQSAYYDPSCNYTGGQCANNQYKLAWAVGYGVPDTDIKLHGYKGFYNQIMYGTWQLRFNYEKSGSSTNWDGVGDWGYGGYKVNKTYSIDGTSVTMRNRATAALYYYTPHLHGNQLFVDIYEGRFGRTTGTTDNYRFERLVGPSPSVINSSSSNIGSHTKTLAHGNNLYVFYHDATTKTLRLSLWDGSRWSNRIIDGAGSSTPGATSNDVGKGIDAVVWKDQIQVYYYDNTDGSMRHAWLSSRGWRTETLDGTASSLSRYAGNVGKSPKVFLYKGNLQIYYYNQTNGSLRHAWWPGDGRWHFETMDGVTGSLGRSNDDVGLKIDGLIYNNGIQLYYYNQTNGSLRHAWWPGDGRWHFETMDGVTGSLGKSGNDLGDGVSTTLYNGKLQLYYYDKTAGNLRHAWWPGDGRWHFETMDGTTGSVLRNDGNLGSRVVARQFQKDLFVFYYDTENYAWRIAQWANGRWSGANLDGGQDSLSGSTKAVGGQLSLDIYNNKSLQIYYQGDWALTHSWMNR